MAKEIEREFWGREFSSKEIVEEQLFLRLIELKRNYDRQNRYQEQPASS